MLRGIIFAAMLAAGVGGMVRAAEPAPPAGSWKLTIHNGKEDVVFMLAFSEQDGKWTGKFVSSLPPLTAEPKITALKVDGDAVQFTLAIKTQTLSFDGVRARDNKKIVGSMSINGGKLRLTELYPTKLKNLDDPFEYARELAAQIDGPDLFDLALEILNVSAEKKVPPEEVRVLVDRVNKAAAAYGPRWERALTVQTAVTLAAHKEYAAIAVTQAKRAERMLTDDDDVATRLTVLEAVIAALNKAGKADEVKPYSAQVAKLETRDYADYAKTLPFKPTPYEGRKAKSDRTVLVEVFTGAECPPCVAVDLAFDGLLRTYTPADVILLQYHLHVPRPDPLTSPDAMKRVEEYYGEQVEGTPTVFISGKLGPPGGGSTAAAEKMYQAFRRTIDEGLEKPAGAKLGLTVVRDEKGYTAKATVSDLDTPGDKVMLRFALAEERVRYTGGNGLRYHHMVVRSMPGGIKGFPLPKKSGEQTVSFKVDDLKTTLVQYLDNYEFPRPDLPLALRNLKLVAFVQNDATREILQAVQIDVK